MMNNPFLDEEKHLRPIPIGAVFFCFALAIIFLPIIREGQRKGAECANLCTATQGKVLHVEQSGQCVCFNAEGPYEPHVKGREK